MTTHRPDASSEPPRDARFDAAWRAASREEPPAALDAAILASARRAVGARPQRESLREATRPERWWWPLAAAATIGAVAIGLLQLAAPDRLGTPGAEPPIVTDMPAAQSPAPSSAPTAARPSGTAPAAVARPAMRKDAPASVATEERAAGAATAAPAAASSAAKPAAPIAANAQPASADAALRIAEPFPAGVAVQRQAAESDAARPSTLGKIVAGQRGEAHSDAGTKARTPRPVPEWIALIRKLQAEGSADEAARELAAFRAAYPDHERLLPHDVRDWRPAEK
jgi:hypothetical protein